MNYSNSDAVSEINIAEIFIGDVALEHYLTPRSEIRRPNDTA